MEALKPFHDHLRDLKSQARKLAETGLALDQLFTEEETRLRREDEVAILQGIHRSVAEQLQGLRRAEASASREHSQMRATFSLAELVATAIVSRGNWDSAIRDQLPRKATDSTEPFGMVMICVGPKGLPDDAKAVSVSRLARDSKRHEAEIIDQLGKAGYLLFSGEAFSGLVGKLIGDIHEGKLHLPVSREKLLEILESNRPKSTINVVRGA